MIVDNLKARCVDLVCKELARPTFKTLAGKGDAAYVDHLRSFQGEAADGINSMSNMALLDLISEVLVDYELRTTA